MRSDEFLELRLVVPDPAGCMVQQYWEIGRMEIFLPVHVSHSSTYLIPKTFVGILELDVGFLPTSPTWGRDWAIRYIHITA